MELFIAALATLLVAGLLAALAGESRLANGLGAGGACLGSLLGLLSLFCGDWGASSLMQLPWGLPLGSGCIGLDALTRLFLLPAFGLGALCALAGMAHLSHSPPHEHNLGAHWGFYCLLIFALALVFAARDSVLFLISWEIMSLAPFFLIDFYDNDAAVREASWIYLVAAHLGVVFLLGMFGLLWAESGSTLFAAAQAKSNFTPTTLSILFCLGLAGFGAKAGLAPFHVWLPEAHPAAPSHISAILSGAMINAGIYGLARLLGLLGPGEFWWGWLLLGVGAFTGILGIIKALGQSQMKRLLAYSSVENMGIVLMGLGLGCLGAYNGNAAMTGLGYGAAFLHVLNHSAIKGMLFLCAGEVLHSTHTVHMEFLGGLQKRLPLVGACFALGACAIACLPPLNGFAGEFTLLLGLLSGRDTGDLESQAALFAAFIALILMGGLALTSFAKAYGISFLGEARSGAAENASQPDKLNLFCLVALALCCVALALGSPLLLPAFGPLVAVLAPAALAAPASQSLSESAPLLQACVQFGLVLLALAAGFWLLRKLLLRKNGIRSARTWDCGCQLASPRIQYSAFSFVEPLSKLFAVIMGLTGRQMQWGELFPSRALCEFSLSDRLLKGLFVPLFGAVQRVCDSLKIVQHGNIHLYILYILVVLVSLLLWGLQA